MFTPYSVKLCRKIVRVAESTCGIVKAVMPLLPSASQQKEAFTAIDCRTIQLDQMTHWMINHTVTRHSLSINNIEFQCLVAKNGHLCLAKFLQNGQLGRCLKFENYVFIYPRRKDSRRRLVLGGVTARLTTLAPSIPVEFDSRVVTVKPKRQNFPQSLLPRK